MVAVESVGYLILYVRGVDVSAAFYRDVVGLPFKLRDAGYAEFVTGGKSRPCEMPGSLPEPAEESP